MLFIALVAFFILQGCGDKGETAFRITETSTLYELDGGTVISKMQSKEDGGMVYSMDVALNGKREIVKITKDEYNSFELGDTIKVIKEDVLNDTNTIDNPPVNGGYKIVTIGGENYLLIKLNGNISINDTTLGK